MLSIRQPIFTGIIDLQDEGNTEKPANIDKTMKIFENYITDVESLIGQPKDIAITTCKRMHQTLDHLVGIFSEKIKDTEENYAKINAQLIKGERSLIAIHLNETSIMKGISAKEARIKGLQCLNDQLSKDIDSKKIEIEKQLQEIKNLDIQEVIIVGINGPTIILDSIFNNCNFTRQLSDSFSQLKQVENDKLKKLKSDLDNLQTQIASNRSLINNLSREKSENFKSLTEARATLRCIEDLKRSLGFESRSKNDKRIHLHKIKTVIEYLRNNIEVIETRINNDLPLTASTSLKLEITKLMGALQL